MSINQSPINSNNNSNSTMANISDEKVKSTDTYIIQLPVEGTPICWGLKKKNDKEAMKQLQGDDGVGGYFTGFGKKDFIIHPDQF